MAEVDTSSYPKPTAPPSLISQVQGYQQLESNKLGIDRQKLENTDKALGFMTRAMGSLGPNATKDQYAAVGQNAVQMGLVPKEMLGTYMQRLQAAPTAGDFYNEFTNAAADHQQQLDYHLGRPGTVETGQTIQPVTTSQKPGFGVRSTGLPIQVQPPPTQPGFDQNGNPAFRGAQPPQVAPGAVAAPPPAPGARLPVASPVATTGPTGPTVRRPDMEAGAPAGPISTPNERVAQGASAFAPGPPAMFEEGKKQLAEDQLLAAQKMTAVKPALEGLKLLPGLRSGPGTEPFNKAVAFLKANNLISTDQENDPTVIYQEANKYLSQYLKGRGGRSDADLAAAEKSSPNVGVQLNPALQNLTKTAIAQDRIEAARANAFTNSGRADYQNYGAHRAAFPQSIDDRAFQLDLMEPDKSAKLVDKMHDQYKKNPKDKEALKFFNSLDIAKKQGFY